MQNYKTSLRGKAVLMNYEAISFKPYLDSGNCKTIGAGSTISDIPDLPSWSWNREITLEQVVAYFEKGLPKYERAVNRALNVDVTQQQFDALVSLAYNIGEAGIAKSTVIKRVNAGATKAAIKAAFLMWVKDNGKVVKGLINRRNKELDLYFNGNYGNGRVGLIEVNSARKPIYTNKTIDVVGLLSQKAPNPVAEEIKPAVVAEAVKQEKVEEKAHPVTQESELTGMDIIKHLGKLLLGLLTRK